MMASTAIWPDLELWLTTHIRAELASRGRTDVYVDRRDPERTTNAPFFVAVRYDGGSQDAVVTEDSLIGIRVGGPASDTILQQTGDLARLVRAIVTASPRPGRDCPIADVRAFNGPFPVEPADRPLMYMTAQLRTVGLPF